MPELFIRVFNMSVCAGFFVLAMLLLRLVLKKAPKLITIMLWSLVAVRLLCPFSFESVFSLIPSAQVIDPDIMIDPTPTVDFGISFFNLVLNEVVDYAFTPELGDSINPLQLWIPVLSIFWTLGMIVLLAYTVISCVKLKRTLATAIPYESDILFSEKITSPFVFGFVKPRIYLPFYMSEKDMTHVIAHEKAHIRGKDHIWKPLGFVLLTVHWFNPLIWLAYMLFCRDLELACDERAIRLLDREGRADYSQALLSCSVNKSRIGVCPLAFGEVGVKKRIKSVLNYKKPAFWVTIIAVALCVCAAFVFLTNPIGEQNIGVSALWVSRMDADTIMLNLGYRIPTGSYHVRYVPEDEWENTSNGKVEYDGALGKYRIYIGFGDTKLSEQMREKFSYEQVVELQNTPVPIRLKAVYPDVHGVGFYVGFDTPIQVDQIMNGTLNILGGWVTIPITLLATQ